MKFALIACCFVIIIPGPARAQVTKFAFTEKVKALSLFINQNKSQEVNNVFSILDNMMTNQINYLNLNITPMVKKYSADTAKASVDLKSAKSAPDPNSPQMIAARNEGKQAASELNTIMQYKNNLATDRALYNSIQPLRHNISGNGANLLNYFNQFAATLQ
jgi:hypothetical protein